MQIHSISFVPKTNIYNTNNKINANIGHTQNNAQKELSNVFYYPINFLGKPRKFSSGKTTLKEKSGQFQISKYNNIPCPACGKKMMNINMFEQISEELSNINPDEYLDYLKNYKEYMRPVEESVFDEIYALSDKEGSSKDIRTLLVQLRDTKLPILQRAQMKTVNKMRSLAQTLPADEQKVLNNKIKSLVGLIKKTNSEAPFRRKVVLDRISKIKIRNPYKYEKLQRIAKTFPTSSDMNSAWIVKYSGKNKMDRNWQSYEIALRFLSSSIANTDHIIAYGLENNHDDISNYMAMHNACNSQKGNKSFLQWLNEDKENRTRYIKAYFDAVDSMIKTRRIKKKKYRHYVEHASNTLYETSRGQLRLFPIDRDDIN